MKSILESFYGDLTRNLVGVDVGDALVGGASHVMGQTANAGGNMPLTPNEAVAYSNLTKQVQLAYAEEDRSTKSPFDTSSPNTMMGSIIQQFIPYYIKSSSKVNSMASIFSAMSNMILGSFSTVLRPFAVNAESTDISQYQLCDDPTIKDSGVAAGPYCNIIYGVPTQYLDEEPITVVNNLIDSNNIDKITGNPIAGSDLETWMAMCTDGKTDQAEYCQITDQKTAEYALYTIDHRIQTSMDPES